jgi:hypothetical protein
VQVSGKITADACVAERRHLGPKNLAGHRQAGRAWKIPLAGLAGGCSLLRRLQPFCWITRRLESATSPATSTAPGIVTIQRPASSQALYSAPPAS